jgi:hypothetical protein
MIIDLRLTQLDCTNDGIEFLDRLRSEGLGFDGNSNPFILSDDIYDFKKVPTLLVISNTKQYH